MSRDPAAIEPSERARGDVGSELAAASAYGDGTEPKAEPEPEPAAEVPDATASSSSGGGEIARGSDALRTKRLVGKASLESIGW